MDTTADQSSLDALTAELEDLYQAGLYRQAYNLGVARLGNPSEWVLPELRILASRILSHLGLLRASDSLIYRLWRLKPDTPRLASYYVSLILRRKGPLQALRLIKQLETSDKLDDQERLYLQLEKVEVYNAYRDFGAAEDILANIPEEERDRWVQFAKAETQRAQDDYAGARGTIDQVIEQHPQFHSALLFKARLLQLADDLAGASALIEGVWPQVQSWWIGRALFDFYMEQRRYAEAEKTLQQLQDLPPWQDRDLQSQLKSMWADFYCAQKEYDKALPFLQSKQFFHNQVAQSISNRKEGERRVLDVPFVRQRNMTCAPASMSAITTYWGNPVPQETIIEAICYGGTQSFDERRWGDENGWLTREFDLTLPVLRALIDRDIPVLLGTVEPGSAHLQIIVGYDLAMGTYFLRDPYFPRLQEMLIEQSHRYYASTGPRCMVLLPQFESVRLDGIELPNSALYDQLYAMNKALKDNRRDLAEQAALQAEALAPGHRLALECRRTLAFYDRDDQALLAVVEQLLQLFPDDINLQLSKLNCLLELGSSSVALAYLESLAAQPDCHFLILARLADRLRRDQRQSERVERLLSQLLRRRPTHTQTLFAYACMLWDQSKYREACQLYRFATCLEDTYDFYADSYFRAARYLKETETGLNFLRQRRDKFGRQSSGPAASLYYALDSLDRTEEALTVLDRAVQERPDDGEFLLFCAQKQLYAARPQKAQELVERAANLSKPVRLHEIRAEIALHLLQKDEALAAYEQVLQIEPLNSQANQAIMRIHAENGALPLAIAHVDRQLERFPGNAMLLRLKYQWLAESDREANEAVAREYVAQHPQDSWGYRTLTYALLGQDRKEEAIAAARDAVAIDSTDCTNHAALGDALLVNRQMREAREAFRNAIRRSCDYGYAFNRLLSSSHDPQEQRADIEFIHAELLAQVSYGDGILEFAAAASRWLEQDKLLEFLNFAVDARPDLWQSWVALGIAQRDQGANEESLATLDKAVEKFPLLPRIHFERAETLRTLHRDDDTIAALHHTLELSPGWVRVSNRLCELLERRGDFAGAIELQKNAIKHSPLSSTPYGYLADLYLRTGERDEAIAQLELAIGRDPGYHWAWTTLHRLRKEDGQEAAVFDRFKEQMEQFPNRVDLLQIYAELEPDPAKITTAIRDYFERRPLHIDLCEKLVTVLAQNGDFANAFAWVSPVRWDGSPPVEIQTLEAWLYAQQHNYVRAIEQMRKVVSINGNHYEAWRLLAIWGERTNDSDLVKQAVENCVRLYPNDPGILCFAAEKLQSVDGSQKRIGELLKHAFELNIADQYIGLTYIDHALANDDDEAANSALERMERQLDNSFVGLRRLQVAARQGDKTLALDVLGKILRDTAKGSNVLETAWKSLDKAGWQADAAKSVEELYEQQIPQADQAGLYLARHRLNTLKPRKFVRTLRTMSFDTDFEQRYLEAYLRHLSAQKKDVPRGLQQHLRKHWRKDTFNLGLVGYLKYNIGRVQEAKWLFKELEGRPDAEPWALYFASLCNRHFDNWEKAAQLVDRALAQNEDMYREDLQVWHVLDCMLAKKPIDVGTIAHLSKRDLAPLTEYPLLAARALAELRNGDCVQVFAQLSPRLRDCQVVFQKLKDSPVLRATQKRFRKQLRAHLPAMPFYRRWFWLWRLANHF